MKEFMKLTFINFYSWIEFHLRFHEMREGNERTNSLITSSGCNSTLELSDLFQVQVFYVSRSHVFKVSFSLFFSISPRYVVTNGLVSGWEKAVKTSQWFLRCNNLFTTRGKRPLLVILRYDELQLGSWSVFCVAIAIKTSDCMQRLFLLSAVWKMPAREKRAPDAASNSKFLFSTIPRVTLLGYLIIYYTM